VAGRSGGPCGRAGVSSHVDPPGRALDFRGAGMSAGLPGGRAGLRLVAGAAFAAALRAKCHEVTLTEVDGLRADAEAHLPPDHPLRRAVMTFATRYEANRFDAAELVAAGDDLARAVELALLPEPPGLGRADIHG
jgi:hypothetical protein